MCPGKVQTNNKWHTGGARRSLAVLIFSSPLNNSSLNYKKKEGEKGKKSPLESQPSL